MKLFAPIGTAGFTRAPRRLTNRRHPIMGPLAVTVAAEGPEEKRSRAPYTGTTGSSSVQSSSAGLPQVYHDCWQPPHLKYCYFAYMFGCASLFRPSHQESGQRHGTGTAEGGVPILPEATRSRISLLHKLYTNKRLYIHLESAMRWAIRYTYTKAHNE